MRRASPRSTELGWRRGFGEQNPSLRLARWRALVRAPSGHSRIVLEAISAGEKSQADRARVTPKLDAGAEFGPCPKTVPKPSRLGVGIER